MAPAPHINIDANNAGSHLVKRQLTILWVEEFLSGLRMWSQCCGKVELLNLPVSADDRSGSHDSESPVKAASWGSSQLFSWGFPSEGSFFCMSTEPWESVWACFSASTFMCALAGLQVTTKCSHKYRTDLFNTGSKLSYQLLFTQVFHSSCFSSVNLSRALSAFQVGMKFRSKISPSVNETF